MIRLEDSPLIALPLFAPVTFFLAKRLKTKNAANSILPAAFSTEFDSMILRSYFPPVLADITQEKVRAAVGL